MAENKNVEKKKKAKLKERNPYAYYRNQYFGLKIGKWISVITPFIVIFSMKFNDYFITDTGTTVKMSIGCILALFVGGLALWNETRKKNADGEKIGSEFSGVVIWGICFALAYLFQSILADLTLILGCALVGQLVGLGFQLGADNRYVYYIESKKAKIHNQTNFSNFYETLKKAKKYKQNPNFDDSLPTE